MKGSQTTFRSWPIKQVGRYWSARVGLYYRTLAVRVGADFIWFWIGTHSEHDRLLR